MIPAIVLAAALAQVSDPAVPQAPAPAPAAAAPEASRPEVHGFLHFQASSLDRPAPGADADTFEFRRARIGVRGRLNPQVAYAIAYDGTDNALKDVFVGLRYVPGLELRLGQFKTPFGYEQQASDTKLMWIYNSYVVSALARGRDSRDLGALLTGKWKRAGVGVEVAAAAVNGALPNGRDDLQEKNLWARAGVSGTVRGVTVRAGGSYGYGHQVQSLGADGKFGRIDDALDDTWFHFHTAGADLTLDGRWFFVAAEYVQSQRDVQRFTTPTAVAASDLTARGWYAGVYGKTPWNAGPVFRVERYDRNDARSATDDVAERYTLGAYLDVQPVNARLLVNYELDRSDAPVRTGDRLAALVQVIF